jgi:hypothetical protein
VSGQRKEARSGADPSLLHDDGAIVQRRAGREDAEDQIVCEQRVNRDPRLDVVAQSLLSLHDDQTPDLARRQGRGRQDQLVDERLALRAAQEPRERIASEARQRPADRVLEDDDDRERDPVKQVTQEPLHRRELEHPRDEVGRDDENHARHHLHGARPLDQQDELIDQVGEDQDVGDVDQPAGRARAQGLKQPSQGGDDGL